MTMCKVEFVIPRATQGALVGARSVHVASRSVLEVKIRRLWETMVYLKQLEAVDCIGKGYLGCS